MSKEFLESAAEKVKNEGLKEIFDKLVSDENNPWDRIVMDLFKLEQKELDEESFASEEELTEESKLSESDQEYIFELLYQKRILEANMNTPELKVCDKKRVFVEISHDECETEYQKRFYDAYYSTEPSKYWVENTFGKFQGNERTQKIKEALMKYENMEYCANPIDLKYLLETEPEIFDAELIEHVIITRFVASNHNNFTFEKLPHSKEVVELLLNKLNKKQILEIVDVCMHGLETIYYDKTYKDDKESYEYFVYNGSPLMREIKKEDKHYKLVSDPVLQMILEKYKNKKDFKSIAVSREYKMDKIFENFASGLLIGRDWRSVSIMPFIRQLIESGFITKYSLDKKIDYVRNNKKETRSYFYLLFNGNEVNDPRTKELFKTIFDMRDLNGSFVYDNSKLTTLLRDAKPKENDTDDEKMIKADQTAILNEYLAEKRPALLLIKEYKKQKKYAASINSSWGVAEAIMMAGNSIEELKLVYPGTKYKHEANDLLYKALDKIKYCNSEIDVKKTNEMSRLINIEQNALKREVNDDRMKLLQETKKLVSKIKETRDQKNIDWSEKKQEKIRIALQIPRINDDLKSIIVNVIEECKNSNKGSYEEFLQAFAQSAMSNSTDRQEKDTCNIPNFVMTSLTPYVPELLKITNYYAINAYQQLSDNEKSVIDNLQKLNTQKSKMLEVAKRCNNETSKQKEVEGILKELTAGKNISKTEFIKEVRELISGLILWYQQITEDKIKSIEEYVLKKMELCFSLKDIMKNITENYTYLTENIGSLKSVFKEFYKKNPTYYEQLSPLHIMRLFGFDISYVEDEELKKDILTSINNMQNDLSKQFGKKKTEKEKQKDILQAFKELENKDFKIIAREIKKDVFASEYEISFITNTIKKYYDDKNAKLKENWKDLLENDIKELEKNN